MFLYHCCKMHCCRHISYSGTWVGIRLHFHFQSLFILIENELNELKTFEVSFQCEVVPFACLSKSKNALDNGLEPSLHESGLFPSVPAAYNQHTLFQLHAIQVKCPRSGCVSGSKLLYRCMLQQICGSALFFPFPTPCVLGFLCRTMSMPFFVSPRSQGLYVLYCICCE